MSSLFRHDAFRRPSEEWERYEFNLDLNDWTLIIGVSVDNGAGMFQAQIVGPGTKPFPIIPANLVTRYRSQKKYFLTLAPIDIR